MARIYVWKDRRPEAAPRAVMQRGRCAEGQCGQYSVSISNGDIGLTIRFESEQEFHLFLHTGEATDGAEGPVYFPIDH